MSYFSAIATAIHALAAVVWVGGMFFAHMALRPAVLAMESPPERLRLWSRVFPRFFVWVWGAVITLLVTGYCLVFVTFGGFGNGAMAIELMHGIGLVMVGLFVFLVFRPYRRFRVAVDASAWPEAARHQATIRRIVATNLVLGLVTVALGASGRYWG